MRKRRRRKRRRKGGSAEEEEDGEETGRRETGSVAKARGVAAKEGDQKDPVYGVEVREEKKLEWMWMSGVDLGKNKNVTRQWLRVKG